MERKTIGVLINVFGSIAINLGNNLQSSGHRTRQEEKSVDIRVPSKDEEEESDEETGYWVDVEEKNDVLLSLLDCSGGPIDESSKKEQKNKSHPSSDLEAYKNKMHHDIDNDDTHQLSTFFLLLNRICDLWIIGTCFFIFGTVSVFISYSFAPQSLLAPLGSVQFVTNIFFAKLIHKAPITRRMLISTSVILVGISLVVHYSPDPNPDIIVLDENSIQNLYYYYNYQVYLYLLGLIAVVSHVTYQLYGRALRKHQPLPMDTLMRPLCYAILSAVIGTQSTLQAKCLSEIFIHVGKEDNESDNHHNQHHHDSRKGDHHDVSTTTNAFTQLFTYLTLLFFVMTTAFWLYRLNKALALFEPLFIIPVLQVFWTCFATLNGGIFFREFFGHVFLVHKIGGFVSGLFIIFFGVYLLAPKTNHSQNNQNNNLNHHHILSQNDDDEDVDLSQEEINDHHELPFICEKDHVIKDIEMIQTVRNQPSINTKKSKSSKPLPHHQYNFSRQKHKQSKNEEEEEHKENLSVSNSVIIGIPKVNSKEFVNEIDKNIKYLTSEGEDLPSLDQERVIRKEKEEKNKKKKEMNRKHSSLLFKSNSNHHHNGHNKMMRESSTVSIDDDDLDDDDLDDDDIIIGNRPRSVSELLDEAQELLFGNEYDESPDSPLNLFTPTLTLQDMVPRVPSTEADGF